MIFNRAIAAAALAVLSATAAQAASANANVNLRSGPGGKHSVLATIPKGASLELGNCSGRWCAVTHKGKSGYVSRVYLETPGIGQPENRRTLVPEVPRGKVRGRAPQLDSYDYRPAYDRGPRARFGYRPYGYDGVRGFRGSGRLGSRGLGSSSRGLGLRGLP
jgi:uncharacterized protein YraI